MIRRFREELGLSQVELADALGVSQGRVSHCETGRRSITKDFADRLIKYSQSIGKPVTYNDIYGGNSNAA